MRKPHDEGSALLMVLGMMMVLSIIVTVAATLAMQTAAFARHSTDWNQALAAAEAGVDDYLARLNADDNYWLEHARLRQPRHAEAQRQLVHLGFEHPGGLGERARTRPVRSSTTT